MFALQEAVWQSTVQLLDFPQWQPQYQAALMELDHGKLLGRVTEAEYAIYRRLHSLTNTTNSHLELLAIEDAIGQPAFAKARTSGLSDVKLFKIEQI